MWQDSFQCNGQQIYSFYSDALDLSAFIAISPHTYPSAIGGCRMLNYASNTEAIEDASRLASAMARKTTLAGAAYGGAKSVILPPKRTLSRFELFKTFGQWVQALQGQYISAIDSGTSLDDMATAAQFTQFVTGYTQHHPKNHTINDNCP